MSFNDKKNMFQYEGISDYEKRRRAREAQGNADNANMAKMYTDTAKEMESGKWYGGNNNKNFVNSIGPMYGQDGYNGTAHDSWKTYGSSASKNVYDDDFTFKISESQDIQNNYGLSRDNYLTQKQQNEQSVDMYNKAMAEASMADQNAYINKIMAEKNAKSQSTALGRGGLGTNSSGQARLNTNYENSLNNIAKGTNDNIDNIYNQYMNAAKALESNSDSLEGMSMISYHDFLIEQAKQMYGLKDDGSGINKLTGSYTDLNGSDREFLQIDLNSDGKIDGDELTVKNPYYGTKHGFRKDTNADGTIDEKDDNPYAGTYLAADKEKQYIDEINALFTDNDYFLSGAKDIQTQLTDGVSSLGSKHEKYGEAWNMYNKIATESEQQKYKETLMKDSTKFIERGAIANVSSFGEGQSFYTTWLGDSGNGSTLSANINGHVYNMALNSLGKPKSYSNMLNKKASDKTKYKIEGDVIEVDRIKYILHDNEWRKLNN